MPVILPALAVAVTTAGILSLFSGHDTFVPRACESVQSYLAANVAGQELALQQFGDAVCDHLQNPQTKSPLVVSCHGPPGVGKSLTHLVAATALYNIVPQAGMRCPGADCPGYKVLYGLDFTAEDEQQQHLLLQQAILDHAKAHPESLLVVEEYDKMSCKTRGFLRQVIENSASANVSLARSIILLESNLGFTQLHDLVQKAEASGTEVDPEMASKVLKDLVFSLWTQGDCEDYTDTRKMLGLVSFFLPYFPLRRGHLRAVFQRQLEDRAAQVASQQGLQLRYSPEVLDFLVSKVEFDGEHAVDGGREAGPIMTRYVSRALRAFSSQHAGYSEQVTQNSRWTSKAWTALKKAGNTASVSKVTGLDVLELRLQSRLRHTFIEAVLVSRQQLQLQLQQQP